MQNIRELTLMAHKPFLVTYLPLCRILERSFLILMPLQWAAAIVCAVFFAPPVYRGMDQVLHYNVWIALILGGIVTFVSFCFAILASEQKSTPHVLAGSQLLMAGLLVYLLR